MHFYAINFDGFMRLPIYTFWELARNVNRIRAYEDRRRLYSSSYAFGGDSEKYLDGLKDEMGEILVDDSPEEFDKGGLNKLASMMRRIG